MLKRHHDVGFDVLVAFVYGALIIRASYQLLDSDAYGRFHG